MLLFIFRNLLGVGLALSLLACGGDKSAGIGQAFSSDAFNSIDVTGADYAKDFHLPDTQGKLRSLSDFEGKAVVVFFGFAQCPDVCPTTLVELAELKKQLGPQSDKLQVVFITVDPERDHAQLLQSYVQAFDPSFVALAPDAQQLAQTAKDFKIYYKKVAGKNPQSYTMDHSAGSYVYDAQGRLRLFTRYGHSIQELKQDIERLLAGA